MIPNWTEEEDLIGNNSKQKVALKYSAYAGIIFKTIFAIGFSYLITFDDNFSMKSFIPAKKQFDTFLYSLLIISLVLFLILSLLNGIINHIQSLYISIKTHSNYNFNSFSKFCNN